MKLTKKLKKLFMLLQQQLNSYKIENKFLVKVHRKKFLFRSRYKPKP